ncbi:hypothetical protein AVEN_131762-1 [Araneus ventricosus]|uniref:Uncharacterized protein n=1 Tax=Araneus ventricosus TaxID=182803 RepID=A0A4Y2KUE7_ARAVE|nr:hypothetical protein AVEN_131762-1 [Araneus ventricosus]
MSLPSPKDTLQSCGNDGLEKGSIDAVSFVGNYQFKGAVYASQASFDERREKRKKSYYDPSDTYPLSPVPAEERGTRRKRRNDGSGQAHKHLKEEDRGQ